MLQINAMPQTSSPCSHSLTPKAKQWTMTSVYNLTSCHFFRTLFISIHAANIYDVHHRSIHAHHHFAPLPVLVGNFPFHPPYITKGKSLYTSYKLHLCSKPQKRRTPQLKEQPKQATHHFSHGEVFLVADFSFQVTSYKTKQSRVSKSSKKQTYQKQHKETRNEHDNKRHQQHKQTRSKQLKAISNLWRSHATLGLWRQSQHHSSLMQFMIQERSFRLHFT